MMTQLKSFDDRRIANWMEIISTVIAILTVVGFLFLSIVTIGGFFWMAIALLPLWLSAALVIYGYGQIRKSDIANAGMIGWWVYCALQNLGKAAFVYFVSDGNSGFGKELMIWCLLMAAICIWGLYCRVMAIRTHGKMKIYEE